jgi:hypothetical protein
MLRAGMDIPSQLTEWNLLGLIQLFLLPAAAGTVGYIIMLRGKRGQLRIQRTLSQDESAGRPTWKIVARALGKPLKHCTVQFDGKTLEWEGVMEAGLNIGPSGIGIAPVTFQVNTRSRVVVKSGPFLIFQKKFDLIDEVILSKGA